MRAVDTNVIVRLVTRDHAEQLSAAEAFVAGGAWVSHIALVEVTWVLSTVYDLSHTAVATAIEMLLNHAQLTVQDADVAAAALRLYRRRPRLGYSDCLMLEVARRAGHLPLGTFDRGLSRLDGATAL
jgi:predicted nucleic-acid-binding protein